jgi:hypothetical protein
MNRDQVIITTVLVFTTIFSLAAWTVRATRPRRPYQHPPYPGLHGDFETKMTDDLHNELSERLRLQYIRLYNPPRPPGPKPDWLIGNLRHLSGNWTESFTAWQKIHGIYFVSIAA